MPLALDDLLSRVIAALFATSAFTDWLGCLYLLGPRQRLSTR